MCWTGFSWACTAPHAVANASKWGWNSLSSIVGIHMAAAELLERVDASLGKRLRQLVGLKPGSHYGEQLLGIDDRKTALRAAETLVRAATERAR